MTTAYEQLGLFYLGKRFDQATRTRLPDLLLYDSKDLLTHAVCVGMTGSGKTGLGIAMIEEAAIDGIPVLAIDPKGDLGNLLLTFPELAPPDFAPWVAPAPGTSVEQAAAEQAALWKRGLAEWDQAPERIARLRDATEITVYTPGSRAGVPLALLGGLAAPDTGNEEDIAGHLASTASSLLSLAGISDSGPHTREQALIAAILKSAAGTPADLPWLVQQIQRPSFSRVGVLDLETFYPAKERQELALRFNSVLAAPGFDVWLSGEPLDVGRLLYRADGRPRVAIVSIAHLGDAERMLVVSMLLSAVLEWTRRQSGTPSLRAMVYMDEVFGYLPPVANPPSKLPLLTLLKQARAYGVGMVLATQNPVDLDYKALSNTGTWFLGKLQTERDKARVLEGIESLSSSLDRRVLDSLLSSLDRRVFLMHNVHEPEPVLFQTRWTLSYLRGPMTREEIERAQARRPAVASGAAAASSTAAATSRTPQPQHETSSRVLAHTRPVLPAGMTDAFLPHDGPSARAYEPVLYGAARVHYGDAKAGVDVSTALQAVVAFSEGRVPIDWELATLSAHPPDSLLDQPPLPDLPFGAVPRAALEAKSYADWERKFAAWILRDQPLRLLHARSLRLTSRSDEDERDFRIRVLQTAHEARDAAVEALRQRYAPKVQRLADRIRAAEESLGRERAQAQQQKVQSAVSIGATMLGALLGRKAVSMSTLGRATTAARGVSRSMKEAQDIARAEQKLEQARADLASMERELESEIAALSNIDASTIPIEPIEVKAKRTGVEVRLVTLAWKAV